MTDKKPAADKTARKQRGKPFEKGRSGNPKGRPKGSRNASTLAAEALLDGDAEALTKKAINLALEGDLAAIRLCLERILPARRERPISFELPALQTPKDAVAATAAIAEAVSDGTLLPSEAETMSRLVQTFAAAIELHDHEERISRIEERQKQ